MDLLKVNVNEHVEKKNGLSYLSWAWAWAEVLKIDANATWEAHEFDGFPASFAPDGSALVKVSVTIKGSTKTCWLPVMNHKNQAIKQPDTFAINTAIVRCMTKCIALFGLGLYIYAGEDLPEADAPETEEVTPDPRIAKCKTADQLRKLYESLPEAVRASQFGFVKARKAELKEVAHG